METKRSQKYRSQKYRSQKYRSQKYGSQKYGSHAIIADYDGKKLAIDIYDNGKHFYSQLKNNDIASILSHRASSHSLEKRLMKDFGIKKQNKKSKSKTRKNR